MNLVVAEDVINFANLKKLYTIIKDVYSKDKRYKLNMQHYTTISGIPSEKDFSHECNSSCCAIGYAFLASVGDTDKYISNDDLSLKIHYTSYSNNELVGKFCNIYLNDEVHMNVWNYLFSSSHESDYESLLKRLNLVINRRWDDVIKDNFHSILNKNGIKFIELEEFKNQPVDEIHHKNIDKKVLNELIAFFESTGYNAFFDVRINDQIKNRVDEFTTQKLIIFGYEFNIFDILSVSHNIIQTLKAVENCDALRFHTSISIGS